MSEFDPKQPLVPDTTPGWADPRLQGARDPHTPFSVGGVTPGSVVGAPSPATVEIISSKPVTSRRELLKNAAVITAGVALVGYGVANVVPRVVEGVKDVFEQIDAAETKKRATAFAAEALTAGHRYLSDELTRTAYPYMDKDQVEPYDVGRKAKSGELDLSGGFGYVPYYHADAGLYLAVRSKEHPFDGVARTGIAVQFKDKLRTMYDVLKEGQTTFEDVYQWSQEALKPKTPGVLERKDYPGAGLELSTIGILVVDEQKSPPEATDYAIRFDEDGIRVLLPGTEDYRDDEQGNPGKGWLTPDKPEFSNAVKQTLKALQKGLKDFSENAKNTR